MDSVTGFYVGVFVVVIIIGLFLQITSAATSHTSNFEPRFKGPSDVSIIDLFSTHLTRTRSPLFGTMEWESEKIQYIPMDVPTTSTVGGGPYITTVSPYPQFAKLRGRTENNIYFQAVVFLQPVTGSTMNRMYKVGIFNNYNGNVIKSLTTNTYNNLLTPQEVKQLHSDLLNNITIQSEPEYQQYLYRSIQQILSILE